MNNSPVTRLALVAVLAVVLFVSLRFVRAPFLLDDIQEGEHVAQFQGPLDAFGPDCYGFFRPVKNLVFFALRSSAGNPAIAHGASIAVFLLAAALSALFFRLFLGRAWAVAAAALWALSPTQVSSIAWLSCLNIVLMAAFVFLAFLLYEKAAAARSTGLLLAASAALAGALFSYEGAAVFCALVFLKDALFERSRLREGRTWIAYALFAAVTAGFVAIRLAAGSRGFVPDDNFPPMRPAQLSFASAFLTMEHLSLWLWPFGRQAIMGNIAWAMPARVAAFAGAWIAIAILVYSAWRFRRTQPSISFGLLWFLIAFLPMSNLVPLYTGPIADYYLVLPSAGLALAAAAGARGLVNRTSIPRRAVVAALTLLVIWRGAALREMAAWAAAWPSESTLYERTLEARPGSFKARAMLARCVLLEGRVADAEALAREAMAEAPWHLQSYYVLSDSLTRQGRNADAREILNRAIAMNPPIPYPYYALGLLEEDSFADPAAAESLYRRAMEKKWTDDATSSALNLGGLLARQGREKEAIGVWESALRKAPREAGLYYNLGIACARTGDGDKARQYEAEYRRLTAGRR